jgi:Regulator of chromosome condensation (RCC1) repeat
VAPGGGAQASRGARRRADLYRPRTGLGRRPRSPSTRRGGRGRPGARARAVHWKYLGPHRAPGASRPMRAALFAARPTPPRRATLARCALAAALGVGGCSLVSSPSLDSLRSGGSCSTCDDVDVACGELADGCSGGLACDCRDAGQLCAGGACVACSALDVSAGGAHSCLLRSDGTVWCWGANDAGQLGDGTRDGEACEGGVPCRPAPTQVVGLDDVVEVQAGGRHTCARRADGGVWCWGANDTGQLGKGAEGEGSASPTRVGSLPAASALSAGDSHTCAVADRGVYCWGANASGELGDSSTRASPRPRGPLLGYERVSAGRGFTCARLVGGSTWCWGANGAGQLGAGGGGEGKGRSAIT